MAPRDVKIVSPPHMVLAAGIIAIVIGAMLMTLAEQNRTAAVDTGAAARWGYPFTAGLLQP